MVAVPRRKGPPDADPRRATRTPRELQNANRQRPKRKAKGKAKGWPANPKLVRHLKSTLIRTGVHVDEAVMGLSVHANGDGAGDNPLLNISQHANEVPEEWC